jgi:hypothetical protein
MASNVRGGRLSILSSFVFAMAVPSQNILARIRSSCAELVQDAKSVRIDEAAILPAMHTLIRHLPPRFGEPFPLPLRFSSVDEEINARTLLQALNFGSGYRLALHKATGNGAWDTMVRGLMSMHITGKRFNAAFLSRVDVAVIADMFGVDPYEEKALMPGVYERVKGPLYPLVQSIVDVMNQCGGVLSARGCADFATLFHKHRDGQAGKPTAGSRPTLKLVFYHDVDRWRIIVQPLLWSY